jgi:GNAT superfamily N-acetyltransferase
MPKVLHHFFSHKDKWLDPTGRIYTSKEFDDYIKSPDFSEKEYINFLSGNYTDDFYSIGDAVRKIKDSKFNTPENNDKIVSNVLKSKPEDREDENYYWRSDYINNIFHNLNYSKKAIDHIINFAKKNKSKDIVKNVLSGDIISSPKLTTEQLRTIVKDIGLINYQVFKSPKMKKSLFDEILESKGHQYSKLTDAMSSKLLDSENALKILNNGGITSSIYLDNLLSKIPKASRNEYIKERLGITGGEKSPAGESYYENDWFYGPKRDTITAESIIHSKYLTSDVIEHIKKYGDFDEKYSLFTNEHIEPKHSIEMASMWANNEEGYDEDDFKDRLKEDSDDDIWETYSDEARERVQDEYPLDKYLRDIGDDDVSKTLFDTGYEDWKKDWVANNKDLTGPNPHFNPEEPESDDNPKTIPYDGSYGRDLDVQDHPDYSDFETDAEVAFEEAVNSADKEPFYDGYDETIRDDIDRYIYDLRDKDLRNWSESDRFLPNHVAKALENPFKNKENPTEKELVDGLNHPLKAVRKSVAKNSKLPSKLIDKTLKGDDDYLKEIIVKNPNITPDQLMKVIKKEKNKKIINNALENIKIRPEHIQEAINRHPESPEIINNAFHSHAANDDHVKSFLNIVKTSEDPMRYNIESVIDSKFNLSPEDVDFIYNAAEQSNMLDSMSNIVRHHSSTKDIIDRALKSSNSVVKVAAGEAQERKFPASADPVNLRIGTHPLRILRDLVSEQGGTTTKGKLKSLGVNADKFNQIFKPNGTISAEDVQKVIDSVPARKYNTSHSTWLGAQRHSDEASKVFQLNYTQEQLDEMQKEGVLNTFRKIYDVSFQSGHPVKNNTIGWVRYTGSPEEGFHIDEIQTDLGQSIIKQTISQAKHAVENEGMDPEEAERAINNAKAKFPEDHLKKINEILFGDKHPSEVLHEAFKEYYRNKGFGDAPIHIWQPESKAPISGMSTSVKISSDSVDLLIEDAKKGSLDAGARSLISWGQKNKLAPASFKEITTEHLDQIASGYKEFANKHREQHQTDPELPVQLPVHMTEGYGKIPKSMGYKESFYGKIPTQKGQSHLQQTTSMASGEPLVTPAKTTYEDKIRKQEELDKGLKGDWQKEGYTIKEADPGKFYDYAVEAVHPEHGVVGKARFKAHQSGNFLIPGDVVVKEEHRRKGLGSGLYQHAAKIYAPIKNLASHQTVAANAMWEKAGKTFGKSEDNNPSALYHYSKESNLKEIDPKKMGTGIPGQFKSKFNPSQIKDFPHASFHYIEDKPEDMVRGAAKSKYLLELKPDQKLYDISKDDKGLVRDAVKENQGAWNYEMVLKKIKDAGYYGVMARNHENPVIANTAMLFYNHPIGKESKP